MSIASQDKDDEPLRVAQNEEVYELQLNQGHKLNVSLWHFHAKTVTNVKCYLWCSEGDTSLIQANTNQESEIIDELVGWLMRHVC